MVDATQPTPAFFAGLQGVVLERLPDLEVAAATVARVLVGGQIYLAD